MLGQPVFTAEYVRMYYSNVNGTRSALKRLLKQNLILKIRNNLYTCVSGETFEQKEYRPELLFSEENILENIKEHPMALWKCR